MKARVETAKKRMQKVLDRPVEERFSRPQYSRGSTQKEFHTVDDFDYLKPPRSSKVSSLASLGNIFESNNKEHPLLVQKRESFSGSSVKSQSDKSLRYSQKASRQFEEEQALKLENQRFQVIVASEDQSRSEKVAVSLPTEPKKARQLQEVGVGHSPARVLKTLSDQQLSEYLLEKGLKSPEFGKKEQFFQLETGLQSSVNLNTQQSRYDHQQTEQVEQERIQFSEENQNKLLTKTSQQSQLQNRTENVMQQKIKNKQQNYQVKYNQKIEQQVKVPLESEIKIEQTLPGQENTMFSQEIQQIQKQKQLKQKTDLQQQHQFQIQKQTFNQNKPFSHQKPAQPTSQIQSVKIPVLQTNITSSNNFSQAISSDRSSMQSSNSKQYQIQINFAPQTPLNFQPLLSKDPSIPQHPPQTSTFNRKFFQRKAKQNISIMDLPLSEYPTQPQQKHQETSPLHSSQLSQIQKQIISLQQNFQSLQQSLQSLFSNFKSLHQFFSKLEDRLNSLQAFTYQELHKTQTKQFQLQTQINQTKLECISAIQYHQENMSISLQRIEFDVNHKQKDIKLMLKQELDQFLTAHQSSKREQSDIQHQINRLEHKFKSKTKTSSQIFDYIKKIQQSLQILISCSKVNFSLLKQDQQDKESIALYGHRTSNFIKSKGSKPIVTVDKECMSCSNQSSIVLSSFKMACLAYNPSPVNYEAQSYSRKELIDLHQHLISQLPSETSVHVEEFRAKSVIQMRPRVNYLNSSQVIKRKRLLNTQSEFPPITQRPDILKYNN